MASTPRPGSLASRLGTAATVLVVEDEPDIATFLGAFFRASGTEVLHVQPTTALEVVELVVTSQACCALVDLHLGRLSGFDILVALGDDARVAAVPVIIVTGDAQPATRQRAVELGAAAFIPKPFNVKDLFLTVQALVGGDPLLGPVTGSLPAAASERRASLRGGVIPAETVQARLATALDTARADHGSACFTLLRVTGPGAGQPAVMTALATVLTNHLAGPEVLGASAPDELALLFPAETSVTAAKLLVDAVGAPPFDLVLAAGRTVAVSWSAGLAAFPEHASTGDELYMAADAALANAVESGQVVATAP